MDNRGYIAAIGSSIALLGAIVIACAALGGIVASGGFPDGSRSAESTSVTVPRGEQEVLIASVDPLLDPVAPDAARSTAETSGGSNDSTGGGSSNGDVANGPGGAGGGSSGSDNGDSNDGDTGTGTDIDTDDGSGEPAGGSDSDGTGDSGAPPVEVEPPVIPATETPSAESDAGGPLDATLQGVDHTVGELTGVDPGLSAVTAPAAQAVDGVLSPLTGVGADAAPAPVPAAPAP